MRLTETVQLVARPWSGESADWNDSETILNSGKSAGSGYRPRCVLAETRTLNRSEKGQRGASIDKSQQKRTS
jgi:hypothetical protein